MSDLEFDRLFSIVSEGNIQKVKELIKGGVDINMQQVNIVRMH